jgi:hypothetical protein
MRAGPTFSSATMASWEAADMKRRDPVLTGLPNKRAIRNLPPTTGHGLLGENLQGNLLMNIRNDIRLNEVI